MKRVIIDIGGYYIKYGIDKIKTVRTIKYNIYNKEIIKNGIVINWVDLEKILKIIVKDYLRINDTFKYGVLVIYKKMDYRLEDIFLNKLGFMEYNLILPEYLILLEKRKKTALIVDIGHNKTKITPIYDNYIIDYGIIYSNFTGESIDKCFNIKSNKKKNIIWNDKTLIMLKLYEIDILKDIKNSLYRVDIDLRKDIINNIIITGRCFNSLIKRKIEEKLNVDIIVEKDLAWKGGRKLVKTRYYNKWIKMYNCCKYIYY